MTAWQRLVQLPSRLSPRERLIMRILFGLVAILVIWQIIAWRQRQTAPARGGILTEALVGSPQILNPLVTADQNDRTVLSLIYPGLTHTDANGVTKGVLAESWKVEDGGKTYTFTLRPNLKWQDGQPLTTSDIADSIQRVVDPEQRSPYQADWQDVTVEVIDNTTLKFHLPQPNAPFLAATSLPITPLHISPADLQQQLIGSGPYKFSRSTTTGDQINMIELTANHDWYAGEPYITTLRFQYYQTEDAAVTAYKQGQVDSILRSAPEQLSGTAHTFATQRVRALFVNSSKDYLSKADQRVALLSNTPVSGLPALTLIVHDSLADNSDLKGMIAGWQVRGVTVNIVSLNSTDLLARLDAHDYDLLFAEIDLKADFDLYPLWDSSQRGEGGYNFAQLSDPSVDKLVEQARTTLDVDARHALATQVTQKVSQLGVYKEFGNVSYTWYTNNAIKGIKLPSALVNLEDRFYGSSGWYIKTGGAK